MAPRGVARLIRKVVVVVGVVVGCGIVAPHAGAGAKMPQVTVTPDAGLVDGQSVQVTGSGYQQQEIKVIECGGTSHPVCSDYGVQTSSDANGDFGPLDFQVEATITGARYSNGNHRVAATYDCTVANDCFIKAYALTRANWSATHSVSFGG